MKKIFSVVLTVSLLLACFTGISVSAAGNIGDLYYEISDGEVMITDCESTASGELTIPSEVEGYPVTSIGDMAFENCSSLTKITIPNGVTGTQVIDGTTCIFDSEGILQE